MSNYEVIDIDSWKRKQHFELFRTYEEPFTGVVVDMDVTRALKTCKEQSYSFFQFYLHKSILAINGVDAMKLILVGNEVRKYEVIHASATIMRPNGTFSFSHIPYEEDFKAFSKHVKAEKDRIKDSDSLFPPINVVNAVHYSSMPWINFRGISHARNMSIGDSCTKVSFGKVITDGKGRSLMPASVHVHHALTDGIDMAKYIDLFQELLSKG